MSEFLEQLRKAVGESHVLAGEAIHSRLHPRRGAHDGARRAAGPRHAGLDGRGVRSPEAGRRARRAGGGPGQRHWALGRGRARRRRHPPGLRPHEADPRDRHREPGGRGGTWCDARAAQRRAGSPGPHLSRVAGRAERLARRQRGHQRRRHARRPLRGHPSARARARGRAGRRHRAPDRREVRQVLERLRPHPAAHRLRGNSGHHDGGDRETPAPVHRVVDCPGTLCDPHASGQGRAAHRAQRHQPLHPRVRRRAW